ncbi:MAG: tetratricopeptide repeat protein, partial [Pseudanabaena sp. M085S1SP2A07QC]|nr:tetratricopeptide repeat protein [Pseudanabaena sp. M085S1SP2A07QC]
MSDSVSKTLTTFERYLIFVERIILNINNGKLLSKEHVYRILSESLESGTGEIFERSLAEHSKQLQANFDAQTDTVKQAKATQSLRAMKI